MKIQINEDRCSGCGCCVEVCPSGAISLIDGVAAIDQLICTQCQACIGVCPSGAIAAVPDTSMIVQPPVKLTQAAEARPVSTVSRPWLASALAFAGREILPRLVNVVLDTVEHRLSSTATTSITSPMSTSLRSPLLQGRGQRRQTRFRGGRNGNRRYR